MKKLITYLLACWLIPGCLFAQNADKLICNDSPYTINSTANPSETSTYQWLENGSVITNARSANYTIPANKTAGVYTYIRQSKSASCIDWQSSNAFTVEVVDGTTPAAPAASGTSNCGYGLVTCTATAPADGHITWWTSAKGGSQVTFPMTTGTSSTYYAQAHSPAGCVSTARTPAVVTINLAVGDYQLASPCGCSTQTVSNGVCWDSNYLTINGQRVYWSSSSLSAPGMQTRSTGQAECDAFCSRFGAGATAQFAGYNQCGCGRVLYNVYLYVK